MCVCILLFHLCIKMYCRIALLCNVFVIHVINLLNLINLIPALVAVHDLTTYEMGHSSPLMGFTFKSLVYIRLLKNAF